VSIAIVNGDTLSAAIVAKKIEAQMAANRSPHSAVFVAQAETRVGRGIAKYLCEHGTQVLVHAPRVFALSYNTLSLDRGSLFRRLDMSEERNRCGLHAGNAPVARTLRQLALSDRT
jgi:hypothetical protein